MITVLAIYLFLTQILTSCPCLFDYFCLLHEPNRYSVHKYIAIL
jgi:hypothetical protein